MSSFRKSITGVRYDGPDTFVKGKRVPASTNPIEILGSIQPATERDMISLPEGRRNRETYRVYTDTILNPADELTKVNADRLSFYGRTFEVISVGPWQNSVIDHYKVIVSQINV